MFFLEPKHLCVSQTLLRAAWHELPGWSCGRTCWAGWVQRLLGLNSCWQPQAPIFMEISILLATACFPTPTASSPSSGTGRHGYVRGLLEIIWVQVYKLSRLIHILSKGTHQAGEFYFSVVYLIALHCTVVCAHSAVTARKVIIAAVFSLDKRGHYTLWNEAAFTGNKWVHTRTQTY